MIARTRQTTPSLPAHSRLAVLTLVLLSLSAIASSAQFNGPGPSVPTSSTATVTTDRALLFPAARDPQLSPGDLISIKVFGQLDYSPQVRLSADGKVQLPFIGAVELNGLTISQAEILIQNDLKNDGIYRDPQVTIDLLEGPNQVATISGEVHGLIPIVGSRRLLDVLSAAGGLPPTASHVITISRPGVPEPIVVDLGTDPLRSEMANVPIFPGDTIIISRIGVVYMIGDFKTAGAIPLTQYSPLTLLQATALSGGVAFAGKYSDLHLIRTEGNHRVVVKLDIKRVMEGKDPDPILQANDIVFLPDSALKASIGNGSLGTLLGISGLLISVLRY
ncbi:MAG TPA: polysaccharide biosynthesis/export family protein [Acidobacteriaceae bacterium]|nr:polysaccharide biosynthesis/export family protein [Acidobacteriaceae bacterium]